MTHSDQRFFATYAREDRALAQPLLALLRSANPDAFLDLNRVDPGNRWPERLAAALAQATTFVIFWSRHALRSESLTGEWQSAIAAEKEIVTVLLDATPVPEPLQAHPNVTLQDLMAMKAHRGAQTTAWVCGAALLAAAVAIPLVNLQPSLWHPQTPASQPPVADLTPRDAPSTSPAATPSPAETDRDTRVRELLSKGRQLREGGDAPTAMTQFQEAATLDDHNPVPFVELAVTSENAGLPKQALEHWQKVYDLGTGAGLYFSLAEAKLKAAHTLTRPGDDTKGAENSPDLTAPVEGIASGSLLGLLPITREDQLDGKSAAHFLLHIPVKARLKARIDVHELIMHVLFYELVDGKRIEETTANIKSHWLNPPANWNGSDTEQLEIEYQLPKPPTTAEEIVDRKYYGYIVRLYYQKLLQASVAEPTGLAKLHPAPPTVNDEPLKPPAPPSTPAPLPQGAFHHQGSSVTLAAPTAADT
ncbi:MAG: toll/interleukin-1 receptor domain-containing protein, partial [Chthoniobacter sp.]|uniref:toll/interleukin-1 receptor domain-containing protein n=1 Tax=Chthoniobacter sp. TaxID=2510640 RepID=UPI0032AD9EE4